MTRDALRSLQERQLRLHVLRRDGNAAENELVATLRPLVWKLAGRWRRILDSDQLDDLRSEGLRGALDAVRKWDPERGSLYAVAYEWIRARQGAWIRLHSQLIPRVTWRVRRRIEAGEIDLGAHEGAVYLGRERGCVSLDAQVHDSERSRLDSLRDPLRPADELIARHEEIAALERAVSTAAPLDRRLIRRRLAGTSLDAIGRADGVTREAVRQREVRVIQRLRKQLGAAVK